MGEVMSEPWRTIVTVLVLLVMLLGLLGTVLPVLPGAILILLAAILIWLTFFG
jgi:uncharacterized protein YqgC (DUF456 family)